MKIDDKWVPREPTAEMLEAAMHAHLEADAIIATTSEVWAAMLAAVPSLDIEGLVEGCAQAMWGAWRDCESCPEVARDVSWQSLVAAPDDYRLIKQGIEDARIQARAVLRHLFGEG